MLFAAFASEPFFQKAGENALAFRRFSTAFGPTPAQIEDKLLFLFAYVTSPSRSNAHRCSPPVVRRYTRVVSTLACPSTSASRARSLQCW